MKTTQLLTIFAMFGGAAAQALGVTFTFDTGFQNGGLIPDGNLSGWADTRTLTGLGPGAVTDVDVMLEISGGWNGDLYAYLAHGSGFSVLLNRVGRGSGTPAGYSDSGLNVVLDDNAAADVHHYQNFSPVFNGSGQITGAWRPDGRNILPMADLLTFDGAPRTSVLGTFSGLNANGDWTLFVADLAHGDVSVVNRWGLQLRTATGVPEGFDAAGNAFGAVAFGLVCWWGFRDQKRRRNTPQ